MKLIPDESSLLSITAIGPGWIAVNGLRTEEALLLTSSGLQQNLPYPSLDQLSAEVFQLLIDSNVEIVLMGCGRSQKFPPPKLLIPLMNKGIGFESMDTAAACRTFNVLAQEGRQVGALLFQVTDT